MAERCKVCGRFKHIWCRKCEQEPPKQTTIFGDISDSHSRVSANADSYQCHKCKKRSWCKDRHPEKASYGGWEKRKNCDRYEYDEEWWT